MADEIRRRCGLEARLIKGRNGDFEVELDGETVFSKRSARRFPEPGEVEAALESRLASDSESPS